MTLLCLGLIKATRRIVEHTHVLSMTGSHGRSKVMITHCTNLQRSRRWKGNGEMSLEMKYFILKPKGTDAFAKASRAAMRVYAKHMIEVDHDLADELRMWADREQIATLDQDEPATDSAGKETAK
jgi:hypothetical protein